MLVESRRAIYAAIGANLAIAVTKFIAVAQRHGPMRDTGRAKNYGKS